MLEMIIPVAVIALVSVPTFVIGHRLKSLDALDGVSMKFFVAVICWNGFLGISFAVSVMVGGLADVYQAITSGEHGIAHPIAAVIRVGAGISWVGILWTFWITIVMYAGHYTRTKTTGVASDSVDGEADGVVQ